MGVPTLRIRLTKGCLKHSSLLMAANLQNYFCVFSVYLLSSMRRIMGVVNTITLFLSIFFNVLLSLCLSVCLWAVFIPMWPDKVLWA
jgi:hypothetical protein